jgi:transcriptional regulator of acetoin/glycerol metabolism
MATKHDWSKLDPLIDNLKAQGWNDTQVAKDLGIGRQTLVDHLRSRELVRLERFSSYCTA